MSFGYSWRKMIAPPGIVPMTPPHTSTTSSRSLLRRFRRNRRGSAAVEFALVAPMFFALLFAIIETGLMFFADQVLETATENSARMIFTGQAQKATFTQSQFQTYVCSQIPILFNCNNVFVDVQSFPSFSTITINSQIDGSGNFVNNMQYTPGGPGDIVVVRLFYQWPILVTRLGYNITNITGNYRLLAATAAFKNEPFVP